MIGILIHSTTSTVITDTHQLVQQCQLATGLDHHVELRVAREVLRHLVLGSRI